MKLYIVGAPGSGKSTLARRLSEITGVPCAHLDEVKHVPDPNATVGNRPRDSAECARIFAEIIKQDDWIIEDTGRACFADGLARADAVVLLDLPRRVLYARVVRRYLRQKLGIEKAAYCPSLRMLRLMVRWVREFDAERFAAAHADKLIRLGSAREARRFAERGTGERKEK